MRLIDPKKIPKMGESTTLEDAPMYEFAQCLVDYLVENYGVDVPDIVRCKDCKRNGTWLCMVNQQADEIMPMDDNDYCSWGKRKDEVTE